MRRGGQGGMTLIEVLVVIAVLGIIVPVISASIVTGLKSAEATADRVALSQDAKLAGITLVPDIQSADTVTTGPATCAGTGKEVVSFTWTEDSSQVDVSYLWDEAKENLVRTQCRGGALEATRIIAHNLSDNGPVVTCSPSCATKGRTVTVDLEVCGRLPQPDPPANPPVPPACRADGVHAFQVKAASRDQA